MTTPTISSRPDTKARAVLVAVHDDAAEVYPLSPAEFRGAVCQLPGANPDDWFPDPGVTGLAAALAAEARAKAGCAACPFRGPCLAWSLATAQHHGVWGGLAADERRIRRRAEYRRGAPRPCLRCGKPCASRSIYCGDECRDAARAASREAAAERREARRPRTRRRTAALHTAMAS